MTCATCALQKTEMCLNSFEGCCSLFFECATWTKHAQLKEKNIMVDHFPCG